MSKLPKISQTPPVGAGEGLQTETEKKRNNAEQGGTKRKRKEKE